MEFVLWKKLLKMTWVDWVWVAGAVLLLAGLIVFLVLSAKREKTRRGSLQALVYGGLCVALAFVLSYIKLFSMPMGGSITLASMLPLLWYAHRYGLPAGLLAGLAYGLLQFIQKPTFVGVAQMLLDYPLAFTCLGLAGLFRYRADRKAERNLIFLLLGVLAGSAARAVCHIVAGALFFAEYAPEGMNAWLYSAGYNGGYLGADALICTVLAVPVALSLNRRKQAA
ncbi:MAG: energy-coupled thiamine transporter ThiT [Clostridiales bacterium]|nr:energy-coupled thiamine transporter ThiT [Clostridiales bacterium]